ncbi:MAG: SSU ribosomal protein S4P [Parcubacteria group bacterium Gr01-1014_8]|nr:MAG: SSU ribosomal protein S4P [Parcubacteria group bacterium Gr01-1014_8]
MIHQCLTTGRERQNQDEYNMLPVRSKYKIGKRLGPAVFEQCQTQKFALSEARTVKKQKRGGGSDYGRQLIEKQRVRYTYGLTEKSLSNYAKKAYENENPSLALHRALEERLDSVVYRAGFALTRRAGRQMVSHGHITVNGIRTMVPSHRLKKGDVFAVREGSRKSALFAHLGNPETASRPIPAWLSVDVSLMKGEITGEAQYSPTESALDYPSVFEFYSR